MHFNNVILGLLINLMFIGLTYAGSLYVDNNANSSCVNRTDYGTESKPWCTISYAIGQIKGGDDLFVKSGEYMETLYIANHSASSVKKTNIQVYPGHDVVIKGAGINTGRIKIIGCNYISFQGFKVTNMNQGIWLENSKNIDLRNCEVFSIGQEGIHVTNNSEQILIQNSIIRDTGKWIYNGEGVYIGTGSTGQQDNTNKVTVKDNLIYNTTDEAVELKPGTHDCIVEGNVIHNIKTGSNYGAIEVNEHSNGNQYWGVNPNHIIRNNTVYDTNTAIRAGTGCLIYNNLIFRIGLNDFGIYIDNLSYDNYQRKIYHNSIISPSTRAVYIVSGDVDIRNNIGPSLVNNTPANNDYFVNVTPNQENYRLVQGSYPIDRGVEIVEIVGYDLDGNARPYGAKADIGAYEYVSSTKISSPKNLKIISN